MWLSPVRIERCHDRFRGKSADMPTYYIQGHAPLVPAIANFDAFMDGLNRYGAGITGGNRDRGGEWAVIGERVEAGSKRAAVALVRERLAAAEKQRQSFDREIRFSVGAFVAEHVTEYLPDGSLGRAESWNEDGPGR